MKPRRHTHIVSLLVFLFLLANAEAGAQKPLNIIFILADDHRYDAMGFMKKIQGLFLFLPFNH